MVLWSVTGAVNSITATVCMLSKLFLLLKKKDLRLGALSKSINVYFIVTWLIGHVLDGLYAR